MAYVIHIHAGPHGPARTEMFARSPVRVGRNPLNDLVLEDPMVSQLHGVFSFDRGQVTYIDVGSTNGSLVAGVLVPRNQPIPIHDPANVLVQVGSTVLSAAEVAVPESALKPTRHGAFDEKRPPTIFYGRPGELDRLAATVTAEPATAPYAMQVNPAVERAMSMVGAAVEAHRAASVELARSVERALSELSEPEQRAFLEKLAQESPHIGCVPELEAHFDRVGADGPGLAPGVAQRFLRRIAEGTAARGNASYSVGARQALERVGAVLETHTEAFVELRRGYQHFAEELGVVTAAAHGEIANADRAALHRYLFDWHVDGAERVDALKRSYAELALHQIALLQGIVAGIRTLLAELSPEAIVSGRNALATRNGAGGAFSWLGRLLPFAGARHFREYAARHRAMVEEDRFTRTVFGSSFARAYFAVTGQSAGSDGRS